MRYGETGLSANVQDGARLDIACNGFWGGRFERTYLDVRVFNPHAKSNQHTNCYRKHELEKKRQYEQRVRDIDDVMPERYIDDVMPDLVTWRNNPTVQQERIVIAYYQGCIKRRGHATRNVHCVCIK